MLEDASLRETGPAAPDRVQLNRRQQHWRRPHNRPRKNIYRLLLHHTFMLQRMMPTISGEGSSSRIVPASRGLDLHYELKKQQTFDHVDGNPLTVISLVTSRLAGCEHSTSYRSRLYHGMLTHIHSPCLDRYLPPTRNSPPLLRPYRQNLPLQHGLHPHLYIFPPASPFQNISRHLVAAECCLFLLVMRGGTRGRFTGFMSVSCFSSELPK